MNVDTASPPPPARNDHRPAPVPSGERFEEAGAAEATDSQAAAVPPQDLALWRALCAVPSAAEQDPVIAGCTPTQNATAAAMEQLSIELGALVDAGAHGGIEGCNFDLELPGLGRLQGRVSVRRDRAELELRALNPGTAAALRSRRHELQQGLDRAVDGEVHLFIA
jgi:hypothetical protein